MSGRILVTGASGFVGTHLVATLARAGKLVRAATRHPSALPVPEGVEVVAVPDFSDRIDWAPILQGVGSVVHLAGIAHVGPRIGADHYDRVNHLATADLASACARAGVQRFVFLSSVRAQCGPTSAGVLSEVDAAHPTEAYGRSKLLAEDALRGRRLSCTILRPAVVYGPGVKGNLASLMRLAALPVPLPLAAFTNRRSLLGIDNLVAAIDVVLGMPDAAGETYLVADPNPVTLGEIVAALRQGLGRDADLFAVPPSLFEIALKLARRGDIWERLGGALVVGPGKLMAAGWRPDADTKAGLARMARALQRTP